LAAEPIPPLPQRDSELVRRVRAGERQLFHELVRRYERAVFVTAYGILRGYADAEEAPVVVGLVAAFALVCAVIRRRAT
jgi:hypothetical protein